MDRASKQNKSNDCQLSLSPSDKLECWSQHLSNKRDAIINEITASVLTEISRANNQSKADRAALNHSLHKRLRALFADYLLPECSSLMGQKSTLITASDFVLLDAVFQHAMFESQQPVLASYTHDASAFIDPYRWLIPCFGGGLLGLMIMGTESTIGAFSGLLGSVGAVAGIAYLAQSEVVQSRMALPIQRQGSVPYLPVSQSSKNFFVSSPAKWLRQKTIEIGVGLAARLLSVVLKPKTNTPDVTSAEIGAAIERGFDAFASLAFIVCMMRDITEKDKSLEDAGLQFTESSIHQALTILMRYLDKSPEDLETIRDMALELQQRLHDEGYVWDVIPEGELFREEFKQRFRLFGLIEPGQPVQTLEPCFMRSGVVIAPGRITRLRG